MGKVLAIDYGLKRTGIAITDELQIIGSPLATVPTHTLFEYLELLSSKEKIDCLVVGSVRTRDGAATPFIRALERFVATLQVKFPQWPVARVDERLSSIEAGKALIEGGMKKKQRQRKENIDKVAAALLLQTYLQQRSR